MPKSLRQFNSPLAMRIGTPRDPNLIFGKNPIREILRAGRRAVHEIMATPETLKALERDEVFAKAARGKQLRMATVQSQQLDKMVAGSLHQGIVARVAPYPYAEWGEILATLPATALILLLDCVQDPQNFGALCRSALAFGVHAVVLPRDRSVQVTSAVCKAASGAVEHLRIALVTNLSRAMEDLKAQGFWIYGAALGAELQTLQNVDPAARSALVLGSEGNGLRALTVKHCDVLVRIPMAVDFDSLNVAQAGTVCLYHFATKLGVLTGRD